MGGHHFGGEAGTRLHLGQFALGLFEGGHGGSQFAVGGGQFLGAGKHLFRQKLGPGAQKLFLRFDLGDVGIDRHPSALRQGSAFDTDRAAIGAGALHVMRLEGAGLFDTDPDEAVKVVYLSVFAARGQMADRVFEIGAGFGQPVGQVEHFGKTRVAGGELEVAVIDRQGLSDQVQPGLNERVGLHGAKSADGSSLFWLPPDARGAKTDRLCCYNS